ncbi:MAG: hypothetical protein GY916_08745 [Gammaproteobacteria bacterium]|jgi:hypothetical protein|nr:hypothetical protein [Chromatiales bacterium]MCP4926018.1 hypothetical protein [Gammaproteobacteria bacterium]MDP7296974.1 hypothetical protein [Gammaproteobacteria bacterium]
MLLRTEITLVFLAILSPATTFGAMEILEEVTELAVSDISLPGSSAGQVVFRECSGCKPTIWQVDPTTTYYVGVDTLPVSLGNLQKAVSSKSYELIYVFYTPGTNAVTRIVLDLL